MNETNNKPWWKSKTLIFNMLAVLFVAIEAKFDLLKPYLPDQWYAYAVVILGATNAVLRIITTQALVLKAIVKTDDAAK
jgi:hypothetical protein